MVFSSLTFLLGFLPVAVFGYYALLGGGRRSSLSILWIFLCSLVYYAWWEPKNIVIILGSLVVNYVFGRVISTADRWRKALFIMAACVNLGALAYYKYTDFFLSSLNSLGADLPLQHIVIPIGISFFTFQQIAYLCDIYTKKHDPTDEGALNYGLFVCFFPQLVSGPIVHHREMMPQFADSLRRRVCWDNIYRGLIMLSIGLAKKVLIADSLSPFVHHAFDVARTLSFSDAAFGALCYTLQLYFDFSGYCDMAIGCAFLFNIELPWNFNSPYKATSIQDFWRRWHMTLSRWLRDYLYIPLGGNRHGAGRTLCNLFLTFLLGGLWHGAAWTFVIWGAMHGAALAIHRVWSKSGRSLHCILAWPITFLFVNLSWIVFRATDFACVKKFAVAFTGANGWELSKSFVNALLNVSVFPSKPALRFFVVGILLIALFGRNSQSMLTLLPSKRIHVWAAFLLAASIALLCIPDKPQEFIYFQF